MVGNCRDRHSAGDPVSLVDILYIMWPVWLFGGLALAAERWPRIIDALFGADDDEDSL